MTLVGYKHREETKEKIRQKALGRKMSEYQKNEIRDRDIWIKYYQERFKGAS